MLRSRGVVPAVAHDSAMGMARERLWRTTVYNRRQPVLRMLQRATCGVPSHVPGPATHASTIVSNPFSPSLSLPECPPQGMVPRPPGARLLDGASQRVGRGRPEAATQAARAGGSGGAKHRAQRMQHRQGAACSGRQSIGRRERGSGAERSSEPRTVNAGGASLRPWLTRSCAVGWWHIRPPVLPSGDAGCGRGGVGVRHMLLAGTEWAGGAQKARS